MLQRLWFSIAVILDLLAFASAKSNFTCPNGGPPTPSVPEGQPTVFMIRHGEKLDADKTWDLNETGQCRAMCVERLFSAVAQYNITKILVETPKCKQKHDGRHHQRPALTAASLAHKLKLPMDMDCDETDHQCVADKVHSYTNQGNVLIVWEHHNLQCIAERLQVGSSVPVSAYPDVFDEIWTTEYPFTTINTTYEQCTEIQNGLPSPSCVPDPAYLCPQRDEHGNKVCVPVFGTRDCDTESRWEL